MISVTTKRRRSIHRYLLSAITILIVIDLYSFGKGYLPVVDPELKGSMTEGIQYLISRKDQGRIARFGEIAFGSPLTSNIGLIYGLNDIDLYDSFSIDRYNKLVGAIEPERYNQIKSFNTLGNFSAPDSLDLPLLNLLGIRFLLSENPLYDPSAYQTFCNQNAGELLTGNEVGQSFRISGDGFYRVDMSLATFARLNHGQILIELRQGSKYGEVITEQLVDVSTLSDNEYFEFTFPPINDSRGKEYFIGLTSIDGEPGKAITVWLNTHDVYQHGNAYINNSSIDGDLCFRAYSLSGNDHWLHVYSDQDMQIYEKLDALPEAFFVSNIRTLETESEQLSYLASTSFQPGYEAIVSGLYDLAIDPESGGSVQLFERFNNRVLMEVEVESPNDEVALLIVLQNDYPGWRAYVDGEEVDLLLTNFTFQAIPLTDGFHKVELIFKPNYLEVGLVLTFLTMAVIALLILFAYRKKQSGSFLL
jgi:hypothetical protein